MVNSIRKQRRTAGKLKPLPGPEPQRLPEAHRTQVDALAILGGFANHVSMAQTGLPTSMSGRLASLVFANSCAHARSIGAIALHSSMFDHHAIMALARMMLEASTMIAYLLDPVSDEEWAFRHALLNLHDTVSRLKLMQSFEHPADDLRAARDLLKTQVVADPIFLAVPEDRRKRLASGEDMFAVGMRSVATRMMGWNETRLIGVYAYFSAHTHSAPMSIIRMEEHRIDYAFPSDTQIGILSLAMEVATAFLRRSKLRMIEGHPQGIDKFHPELLAEAYAEDAACPFFASSARTV